MRILLLKFGALGDVLMTTPLLRQVRRAFPQAQIDFAVAAPYGIALRENPHLNKLIAFDPKIFTGKKIGQLLKLSRQLRAKKYDLVFVLDKHWIFALVAWLAGIPQRLGFARDGLARFFLTRSKSYGGFRHDIHSNLDLLAQVATVDRRDTRMEFCRSVGCLEKLRARFPQLRQPYFACCNSGGENLRESSGIRKIPRAKFHELLEILSLHQFVVLLGNERDRAYYDAQNLPANVLNLAGQTTIAECAELIAGATRIFTTDCGLMHLAATTETPITAFLGPTHPQRLGPLDLNAEILWSDEHAYDPEYQTRGRIPRGPFFTQLDLQSVREGLTETPSENPQLAVA